MMLRLGKCFIKVRIHCLLYLNLAFFFTNSAIFLKLCDRMRFEVNCAGLLIFHGKNAKFRRIFRGKFVEKLADFAGFSWEKSQNLRKNWLILSDFRGKKSKFAEKSADFAGEKSKFAGKSTDFAAF